MRDVVYFMRRVGGGGPVKIGWSQRPQDRVYAYNTMSPYPLEIVATVPGSIALENRFHAHFAHLRSHREWFHESPEIDAVISQAQAGTFDTSTLPDRINSARSASAVKSWASRRASAA
jgi:hypothetical protein